MKIELTDQVAWITGGSSGIGREIAIATAQCGAKVAISAREEEEMQDVVTEIRQAGGDAMYVAADVSDSDQVKAAAQQIYQKWGRLDFVCANAGTNGTWAPVDNLSPREWESTISVNLTGTFLTIHHALPYMKKSKAGGCILIISSVNGTRMFSNEGASAYAVSKAGQLALGKMLALELAPSQIRVNVICPGAFTSEIHDKTKRRNLKTIETPVEFPEGEIPLTQGEMGDPKEVAQLAVFLASDLAKHITGTPIWIDGAQSLLQG